MNTRIFTKNWEFKLGIFIVLYYTITHFILETTNVHNDLGLSDHLRVIPQQVIDYVGQNEHVSDKWAYMQYSTNYAYLNLALINFIRLRKGGSKIVHMVVLYAENLNDGGPQWLRLQELADAHQVELKPIQPIMAKSESSHWADSFTKFAVLDQYQFDRIVYFDSDSMVLKDNLDELFQLEEFDLALPQAYWLNNVLEKKPNANLYHKKVEVPTDKQYTSLVQRTISEISDPTKIFHKLPKLIYEHHKWDNRNDFFANHVMVLKPSHTFFKELMEYVNNPWSWYVFARNDIRKDNEYDMEIMNKWLDNKLRHKKLKVGILPHRTYGVLTGEFREKHHRRFTVEPQYLPFIDKFSTDERWDPQAVARQIKLAHFSDSPIPKPWEHEDNIEYYNNFKIYCDKNFDPVSFKKEYPGHWVPRLTSDCVSVEIWDTLRSEYRSWQEDFWVLN